MMDTLKAWLATFPGWELVPDTDHTGPEASVGLFPQGDRVVREQQDILGNRRLYCQASFTLCRMGAGRDTEARELLALQTWVRQQSAQGLAPVFGSQPEQCRITLRDGKLRDETAGLGRYTVELTVEYTQ